MKIASLFALVFAFVLFPLAAADNVHPNTLKQYEAVRAALVMDNLAGAKKAATDLASAAKAESAENIAEASQKIADSPSLKEARIAFLAVSIAIEKIVKGQPGYFIVTCPMIKGSVWVQTTEKIGNPYAGKEMPECGEIKK